MIQKNRSIGRCWVRASRSSLHVQLLTWSWRTSEAGTISRPIGCTRWLSSSQQTSECTTGDDFEGVYKDQVQRRVKTLRVSDFQHPYLQSSFD